jgi:hypothetical protein
MSATIRTTGSQTITWPDGSVTTVPIDVTSSVPVTVPTPPDQDITATVVTSGTQTITRSDGSTATVPLSSTQTVPVVPA